MLSPQQIRRIYGQAPPNLTGAVLLGGPEVGKVRLRNRETGRVFPCCWSDCMVDGDDRYRVTVPHDDPDRRDKGDTLTYIFCSDVHKHHWLAGLPKS